MRDSVCAAGMVDVLVSNLTYMVLYSCSAELPWVHCVCFKIVESWKWKCTIVCYCMLQDSSHIWNAYRIPLEPFPT